MDTTSGLELLLPATRAVINLLPLLAYLVLSLVFFKAGNVKPIRSEVQVFFMVAGVVYLAQLVRCMIELAGEVSPVLLQNNVYYFVAFLGELISRFIQLIAALVAIATLFIYNHRATKH